MILRKGMRIRCRNEKNDVIAVIILASENGKSIFVQPVDRDDVFRVGGGLAFGLPLLIDYEAETVTDGFVNESWEIDVEDPQVTYSPQ